MKRGPWMTYLRERNREGHGWGAGLTPKKFL